MSNTLYSLRTDGDQYRITKFVDGEPEGSYLVGDEACECPAGVRPSCRHRQMLPQMLAHGIANTHWFMAYDAGGAIVDFNGTSKQLLDRLAASQNITATEVDERMARVQAPSPNFEPQLDAMLSELAAIPGVQVLTLDDPAALHNTIAEAVGEPTVPAGQHCQGSKSWRRL